MWRHPLLFFPPPLLPCAPSRQSRFGRKHAPCVPAGLIAVLWWLMLTHRVTYLLTVSLCFSLFVSAAGSWFLCVFQMGFKWMQDFAQACMRSICVRGAIKGGRQTECDTSYYLLGVFVIPLRAWGPSQVCFYCCIAAVGEPGEGQRKWEAKVNVGMHVLEMCVNKLRVVEEVTQWSCSERELCF